MRAVNVMVLGAGGVGEHNCYFLLNYAGMWELKKVAIGDKLLFSFELCESGEKKRKVKLKIKGEKLLFSFELCGRILESVPVRRGTIILLLFSFELCVGVGG